MKFTRTVSFLFLGLFFLSNARGQGWQWGRANTGAFVEAWPVATDKSGDVFVAGIKLDAGLASFGPIQVPCNVPGGLQCILTKYDANGGFLWSRGTMNGPADLIAMTTDPSGNAYMLGRLAKSTYTRVGSITLTNSTTDNQYFLAKYDPAGNVVWALNEGNAQTPFSGTIAGMAYMLGMGAIATDDAGNVYITVNFHTPIVTAGGSTLTNAGTGATNDVLVVKYNPAGGVVWAKSIGGSGNDEAYAITVTHAGDVYVAGIFGSPSVIFGPSTITNTSSGQVTFIARFDASGNPVWAEASGGNGREYASGLAADVANNVYMIGGIDSNIMQFSGAIISNLTDNPALYFVKFDPSNNVHWYKTIHSPTLPGKAYGYSVATSSCGEVWITGALNKSDSAYSVAVDASSLAVPPSSSDPVLVAGFTISGHYVGGSVLQSGGDDQVGVATDAHSNVYLAADYDCKSPFSVAGTTFPAETDHEEYMYLAKFFVRDPAKAFKHSDTTFCFKSGISISAPVGYKEYTWNDGYKGISYEVKDTGIYWVLGQDSCAAFTTDTFHIKGICDCANTLFLPNTITPNGDGQNDVFYPRSGAGITRVNTFRIYNRWGTLLFERENILPNDPANAWDGSYQGSLPLPDVYVYVVDAVCENGKVINKKGSVTVVR